MRLTAFVKIYKICILLHRCNLNFGNEDEVSRRKRRKTRKKINPERKKKKENRREALRASLNYAEELGPLLFLGRRSETDAGWLSFTIFSGFSQNAAFFLEDLILAAK